MENITFKIEGTKTLFSCGCKTDLVGETFLIAPCSPSCEVYEYILEQSARQDNSISFNIGKDNK